MNKINKNLIVSAFVLSFVFSFTSAITVFAASPASVNLGSAGNFVILSKTGISTTGSTAVIGDIGVSPAAASYVTGFALTLPAAGAFSTSALVTGKVYASDYANPTPTNLTTAVLDMQNAYTDAMGRAAGVTELGAGNIGGLTLASGVYKWGTGLTIPTNVTLSGSANDVWIFQIAQNLDISSATNVVLSGGAQASNIFWVVAGQTTVGTTAVMNGNILDQTAIVLNTGARLNGRALAQTAVTLDSNAVTVPSGSASSSTSTGTQSGSSSSNSGTAVNTTTTPATPAVPATQVEGCVSGNLFSATSGKSCTMSATPAVPAVPSSNSNVQSIITHNFGDMNMGNGSVGVAVLELQRFLNVKLNLGLAVDGIVGPKTLAAIVKWQQDNGLVADGIVGQKTKAKMYVTAQ